MSSFCISSKRVVPVKYSRQKDSVEDSYSKLSKRETCVNLFYSTNNLSVLLEGFSQLTIQDRPCLVTQIVCNCLREYPKLHDRIQQYVLLMDWMDFQNRTVRIELCRVNQDVNILETSQAYSSRASKVSFLRTGVTLRQVCQVLTPSSCPRRRCRKSIQDLLETASRVSF